MNPRIVNTITAKFKTVVRRHREEYKWTVIDKLSHAERASGLARTKELATSAGRAVMAKLRL